MGHRFLPTTIVLLISFLIAAPFWSASAADSTETTSDRRVENASIDLPEGVPSPKSLGRPSRHRFQWGLVSGYSWDEDHLVSRLFLNDHIQLYAPQLAGINFTAGVGVEKGRYDFSGTGTLYAELFGLQNGLQYDTRTGKFFYRLAVDIVARRGGLAHRGDRFRVEWVPATRTVQAGITINTPWVRYRPNRPLSKHTRLMPVTRPKRPASDSSLYPAAEVRRIVSAMHRMDQLLTPRLVYDIDSHRQIKKFNRAVEQLTGNFSESDFLSADSTYHAGLEAAFARCLGDDAERGAVVAEAAERILLHELVIPINRLFGQYKKPFDFSQFSERAIEAFWEELTTRDGDLDEAALSTAMAVFHSVASAVEEIAETARARWDDDRLVWVPLNFGLRTDQYDSQSELNGVIESLLGRQFKDANSVQYLHNDRGYHEFERMVRDTRFYHVLHIHDISGRHRGAPDRMSWKFVTEGYMAAFLQAIREIDKGDRDRLPQFIIFLDEFYYHKNAGAEVLSFLEDMYDPGVIRIKDSLLQRQVRDAHGLLVRAIAESPTFGGMTASRLRQLFKVHISVTNQFDPAFTEDAIARDHRKIGFRDVFEDDPESGAAIFSGMGIGEHYVGPCWEDRSLLVRGPDLVHLKTAARRLFLSQGFDSTEVPFYLRPRDFSSDFDQRCRQLREQGWTASLINTVNETGFGFKNATIVKAVLYNLMQPGTMIVIPDSIWGSDFWAGMLTAAALRGCQVYAIAPANQQAPSTAEFTLETIRKTLKAMVRLSDIFSDDLRESGGVLQVRFYRRESDVHDIATRLQSASTQLRKFKTVSGIPSEQFYAASALDEAAKRLGASFSDSIRHLVPTEQNCVPKLHSKAQLFLSREAVTTFFSAISGDIISAYAEIRRSEVTRPEPLPVGITPALFDLPDDQPRGDGIMVLTIGSHNQDRRSMVLDGETLVVLTGREAAAGMMDFILLLATSRKVESPEDIDREFPRTTGLMRAVVKLIKDWI